MTQAFVDSRGSLLANAVERVAAGPAAADRSAARRPAPRVSRVDAAEDLHDHRGHDAGPGARPRHRGVQPDQRRAARSAAEGARSRSRGVYVGGESATEPPRVSVERAELRRSSRSHAGPLGAGGHHGHQRHHRRHGAATGQRRVGLVRHVRRARHRTGARPPLHRRGHAARRAADDHPRPRVRADTLLRQPTRRPDADRRRTADRGDRRAARRLPLPRRRCGLLAAAGHRSRRQQSRARPTCA